MYPDSDSSSSVDVALEPLAPSDHRVFQSRQPQPQTTEAPPRLAQQRFKREPKHDPPWGDSIHIHREYCTRLYFMNPRGLDLFKWNIANMRLKQRKAEIYGFAATDINWTEDAKNRYFHRLKQLHTRARMQTSDSDVPFSSDFKPGGTCQVVTGDWQSRVMKHGADKMGRWSYFQLDGKKKKSIMFTTAYRVSQRSSGGPNTAYTQQRSTLLADGNTTQPRKQFISDLISQVNTWSANGIPSIVMLDANECIGDEIDGISRLQRKTKLVDLHAYLHEIED